MRMSFFCFLFTLFFITSCSNKEGNSEVSSNLNFDRSELGILKTDNSETSLGEVPFKTPHYRHIEIKNNGVLTARNIVALEDEEINPVFYYTGEEGYPGEEGDCGTELKPGASCIIHIVFYTDEAGFYSKDFNFTYHNGEKASKKTVTLSALAGAPAEFEFQDSINALYDLGGMDVTLSSPKTKMITITNIGDLTAKNIIYKFNAPNAESEAAIKFVGGAAPGSGGTCGTDLAGGDSCTINIEYKTTDIDVVYSNFLFLNFADPIKLTSTFASFQILGIEDAAYLIAEASNPKGGIFADELLNTSVTNEIEWTLKNTGTRDASSLNFVDIKNNPYLGFEFSSTTCGATLIAGDFCKYTYKIKPNYPANDTTITFPRDLDSDEFDIAFDYNDGKNIATKRLDELPLGGVILGQGFLMMQMDKDQNLAIDDGSVWGSNAVKAEMQINWAHVAGNANPRSRTIRFVNGVGERGRKKIDDLTVVVTPNDGLLTFDNTFTTTIDPGKKLDLVFNYQSDLDESESSYTDNSKKTRDYNIKVTYHNGVEPIELNFIIEGQDLTTPIIRYAYLDGVTEKELAVIDESNIGTNCDITNYTSYKTLFLTYLDTQSLNQLRCGFFPVSKYVYSKYVNDGSYTRVSPQIYESLSFRIYNDGYSEVTPTITPTNGTDPLYQFEILNGSDGTKCLNKIKEGGYCEYKVSYLPTDIEPINGNLVTNIDNTLGGGDGEFKNLKFKLSTAEDDKPLYINYSAIVRQKGLLAVNTNHNPDITTDFIGDFKTVDMLYESDTERTIPTTGDDAEKLLHRIHLTKTGHGEVNHPICEIVDDNTLDTRDDTSFFECNIVEIPITANDFFVGSFYQDFPDYLEHVGKTKTNYVSKSHVKFVVDVKFSFSFSNSDRIDSEKRPGAISAEPYNDARSRLLGTYGAKLRIKYHGKDEDFADPYHPSGDIFDIPLAAEVKDEARFKFELANASDQTIDNFRYQEVRSPIDLYIKNIGGDKADITKNNVRIYYYADMYKFDAGFHDFADTTNNVNCPNGDVSNTVTGSDLNYIELNIDGLGQCKLKMTPIMHGDLKASIEGPPNVFTEFSRTELQMIYNNSYEQITEKLDFTVNKISPISIQIGSELYATTIGTDTKLLTANLKQNDLDVGESRLIDIQFISNLGQDSLNIRDVNNLAMGDALPFTLDFTQNPDNQFQIVNAQDTAGCDIVGPDILEADDTTYKNVVSFHTTYTPGSSTTCIIRIKFTPQIADVISQTFIVEGTGTFTKNFELATNYYEYNLLFDIDDDKITSVNPALEFAGLISFSNNSVLGESQTKSFTIKHNARVHSDKSDPTDGVPYYDGPIIVSFKDGFNALNTATLSWAASQPVGCTLMSAGSNVQSISYHAKPQTNCNFEVRLVQAVYNNGSYALDLKNIETFAISAKIMTHEAVSVVDSGNYNPSFAFDDPAQVDLPAGNNGEKKTETFTITTASVVNTNSLVNPVTGINIPPVKIRVTDTQNYKLIFIGGDCTEEAGSTDTVKSVHFLAGGSCSFTLEFTIPEFGLKENKVEIVHVDETYIQASKTIQGRGLNYANMAIDNFGDMGEPKISAATTTNITMVNDATDAANGQIVSAPIIMTGADCSIIDPNTIGKPEWLEGLRNTTANSAVFSLTNNSCTVGLELSDDSEQSCTFDITFTPLATETIYSACIQYRYKRFPAEPEIDPVTLQTNWRTVTKQIYGYGSPPDLNFTGYKNVKGINNQITFDWDAMTINNATISGYSLTKVGSDGSEEIISTALDRNLIETVGVGNDIQAGYSYTYTIKATVVYDADGYTVERTPNTGSPTVVSIKAPGSNQVYLHANGKVYDRAASGSFSKHINAKSSCEAKTVGPLTFSLISQVDYELIKNNTDFSTGAYEHLSTVQVIDSNGNNPNFASPVSVLNISDPDFDMDAFYDKLASGNANFVVESTTANGYSVQACIPQNFSNGGGVLSTIKYVRTNKVSQTWCEEDSPFAGAIFTLPVSGARCVSN